MKSKSPGCGNGKWYSVIVNKNSIVANANMKVLFKVSKVEDTIEGTIKKITKGFLIPPVKNNKKLS